MMINVLHLGNWLNDLGNDMNHLNDLGNELNHLNDLGNDLNDDQCVAFGQLASRPEMQTNHCHDPSPAPENQVEIF